MANSGFDPLRNDPFAPVVNQQAPAIVPVSSQSQPSNNQWSLQEPQPGQQPETNGDILLQFNNTNSASATNDVAPQTRRMRLNSASSLGSRSARSGRSGSNVFGNLNVAPPPQHPVARDYTQSQFHAEKELNPRPPPDFNEVSHSGQCIARISMRTLVMKKWKRIFWITYGNDKMLFFRSQVDFEEWVMNPHLSWNQREKLVKLRIDFEDPNKSTRKDTEQIKGFHASVVKHKFYKSTGNLQQFKLDKWTDQGPTIMAAFGSMNPAEIKEFHIIMSEMLQQNPMNEAYSSAMVDARDGDSSGHYPSEYSVGSNPTFARGSHDDSSYHSGYSSSRSINSGASRSKYLINNIKSSMQNVTKA